MHPLMTVLATTQMEQTNATRYRIQCGRLNSSRMVLRAGGREEDEILSCSAAAHTVTRDVSYGSGANEGNQRSAAGKRDRETRGRCSALACGLDDRPRP